MIDSVKGLTVVMIVMNVIIVLINQWSNNLFDLLILYFVIYLF